MRRIVILHGLSATSQSDWYLAVAEHYRQLGYAVHIPNFPGSNAPNLNRWTAALHQELQQLGWPVDSSLSLIGHSTGVMAALRFVESLPDGTVLGPSIMVAGFPKALFHPHLPVFVARAPNINLIKPKLPYLLAVHSTNDWRVPLTPNSEWFKTNLNAEVIVVHGAGHFIRRHGWTDWTNDLYEKADGFLAIGTDRSERLR